MAKKKCTTFAGSYERALLTDARREARKLGHDLDRWTLIEGETKDIFLAACMRCGAAIYVDVHDSGKPIGGVAVQGPCPGGAL
jgi:hypothetical protein